ncbi:penicillin-binding transpeptidase domain-containing protein [Roseobacter sp. HKCCA0434]|uniref:penicillin-binding transpeptidase domain-containing protein n=1 Tax=Roseobacter sp. HKCCA0434 TaxID=3079297 RepID=UPI002905AC74|nr:penicillin-binding transpeptidase domain-containing protein [Roseobacter sp. HKCCA0434]
MRRRAVLCGLAALALPLRAQTREVLPRADYARFLHGQAVSFLYIEGAGERIAVLEGSDLAGRVRPYSTFKIPNTLIALEEGVATGPDHVRPWDARAHPRERFWPPVWAQDHDLASAFRNSVVWYYREIAREVSAESYAARLTDWRYGNADPGRGNDRFWLDGTLQISVAEQVAFLSALAARALPGVEGESYAVLDAISRDGEIGGEVLHGKTGAGRMGRMGGWGGWYVGWIGGPRRAAFALYAEAERFREIDELRRGLAVEMVERLRG